MASREPARLKEGPHDVAELTIRGIVLGGLTLVFTAANVYLGLKLGITFATSIPAEVISIGRRRDSRAPHERRYPMSDRPRLPAVGRTSLIETPTSGNRRS